MRFALPGITSGAHDMRIRPNFALEQELWGRGVTAIAGEDEVGVGAFAGLVIAAAVILAPGTTIRRFGRFQVAECQTSRGLAYHDQPMRA